MEFKVPTVSHSFFLLDLHDCTVILYGLNVKHAGHQSVQKNEVSKIFIIFLSSNRGRRF